MYIELTDNQTGSRVLISSDGNIMILDTGTDKPARWTNHNLAINYYFKETYQKVKVKLYEAGLLREPFEGGSIRE